MISIGKQQAPYCIDSLFLAYGDNRSICNDKATIIVIIAAGAPMYRFIVPSLW